MKKELLRSSLARMIENGAMIVTSLILTPFLIRTLGDSDYGLWILILSIIGWFRVLGLGLPSAVQRFITIALEQRDTQKVNVVFSTSLVIFCSIAIVAFILIHLLIQTPWFFGTDAVERPTMILAISLLSIKIVWDMVMNAFFGFFSGLLRQDVDAVISTGNALLKAVLIFLLVPSMQIEGAVYATLAADFASNILKIYSCYRLFPEISFSLRNIRIDAALQMVNYGKHVIAIGLAEIVNLRAAPFIIVKTLDLIAVAIFAVADRLTNISNAFATAVTGLFLPVFTKKVVRGDDLQSSFYSVATVSLFLTSFVLTILVALGSTFIVLWIGPDYVESFQIALVLAFVIICRAVGFSIDQILLAQANHKQISLVKLAGAILHVVLSVALAKKIGLLGVVIGSAIGSFVADVVLSTILLRKHNNFELLPLYKTFIMAVVVVFGAGHALRAITGSFSVDSWLDFAIAIGPISLVCVLICAYSLLTAQLRKLLIQTVKTYWTNLHNRKSS